MKSFKKFIESNKWPDYGNPNNYGNYDIDELKKYIGKSLRVKKDGKINLDVDVIVLDLNKFSRKEEFPLRGKITKIYFQGPFMNIFINGLIHFKPEEIVSNKIDIKNNQINNLENKEKR